MKKLMIMLSAASLAIGLRAAGPYPSGSAFNGETLDEAEQALWSSTEGLSIDKEVTAVGYLKDRPELFNETTKGNSLKISTSLSAPVYRAIVEGATPQDIGTGVYVDTLVKFTAFDPEDVATIDGTDAKLAVWVKEIEGETPSYQLMVTAGRVDGETVTVQNYVCATQSAINTDDWYRLTIKSIKNINGDGLMGFVVFVDGDVVSSGESKFANVTLTQQAALWDDSGKLFPALVKQDSTLKQVGFAGQGHIDDFSITDAAPGFAADLPSFTVTGGDHVVSFMLGNKTWNVGDDPLVFIANSAAPRIATIVYETGYFGDETQELEIAAGAALAVGNAKALAATVTIDGKETKCETLADAIAAVNAATSAVTLKLGAAAAGITLANANATITIDLAGQTITQGAEDTAAIYVESGMVVVDDTVGGGTVQGIEDAGLIALVVTEGSATLSKGIYKGVVGGEGLAITSADVKILASANPEGVSATLPEGMMLQEGTDGYLSLVEMTVEEDGTAAHPYTISTVADLEKLNTHKTGSKFFELKNDITLTEKWAGIGTYDNDKNADAFDGTFDGKGFAIRGVTFADNGAGKNNYRGFFNQVNNATIKNLTIEGDGFGTDVPAGEYGCALVVGCANNSTIENCVASGTIASGTHNVGGIAVRIKDTTIKGCTNKANITGSYTKVGGIVVLCQNSTASFLIENCTNEGTLTVAGNAEKAGKDGLGGIIAYVGDAKLTLKGCSNTGALVTGEGAHPLAKVGQIVGYAYTAFAVEGTFTVRDDIRSVGSNDHAANGLNFATVADGVATLVADSAAVNGANLKVMAAGQTVTLGAIGESITLDTTLATVTVTTTAENAEVKQEGNVYTVVAKTGITAWTDVTDDTPLADIPGVSADDAAKLGASNVKPSAIATWANDAAKGNVTVGEAINLDAFVMDAANTATTAELEAKAAAEITQEVLDAIVADGTAADISAIAAKYPNATVTVVPATELVSTDTAKFFKLKFELKVAQ